MKKHIYLFSSLIFLFVLIAFGCENNNTTDNPTTDVQKSRLNNFTDWATYRGDKEGTQYSDLDQITPENVQLLEEVWTYDTKNLVRPGMESNPIVIEGVMYFSDPELNLVALDAATGDELWLFDPSEHHSRGDSLSSGLMRGETYWEDENGNNARIFHLTQDLIWAINPDDGTLIQSFGKGGYIDLKENHVWPVHLLHNKIRNSSPPVTYKDHLIVDSNVHEDREEPPGNIRSFNTITGEFEWRFHTIPLEGQPGYETWAWEDNMNYGGANSWGGFTIDEERGWVFAATGAATGGIHGSGGARPGKNLFSNSVLAIDAETGELQWHFQTIHHDIWDYDIAPPPMLSTITKDGKERDVVVQTGKQGKVFVFDRDTGESLFPIVEKPVPTDAAPGEVPYPTQPWPLKPDPLVRTSFYESDLTDITPESYASALEQFKKLRPGPMYTPPSIEGTIVQPGIHGGNEWGGPAFDPETNIAYVNVNDFPFILTLDPMQPDQFADMTDLQRGRTIYSAQCAVCHGANRQGGTGLPLDNLAFSADSLKKIVTQGRNAMPAFLYFEEEELNNIVSFLESEPSETESTSDIDLNNENLTWSGGEGELHWSTSTPQYVAQLDYFTDHMGYHAIKPPWGKLVAVDVAEGEIKWSVPLGEYPGLVDSLGIRNTGAENFGGLAVTKGGVIFIAATEDNRFRAFDKSNGELLWEFEMDAPGFSSPSVYEIDGRQYVVIVAGGGGGRYRSPVTQDIGRRVHTFALPESEIE
jgi:quinoprotein glucose dehydrogenase